jgi:HSP20 family protein
MDELMNQYPFADFNRMFGGIERNIESVWRGPCLASIPVDLYEKADAFYIRAAVPGALAEDVDLSVEGNVVTLRGTIRFDYEDPDTRIYMLETPCGRFNRSIRLPENCHSEGAEASYSRGVLTVRIPKAEVYSEIRSIPMREATTSANLPLEEVDSLNREKWEGPLPAIRNS